MILLFIIQATQYLPPYFVMKINAHISIVHSHRYKILWLIKFYQSQFVNCWCKSLKKVKGMVLAIKHYVLYISYERISVS